VTIQADLLAALDYMWSGTAAGAWVASDQALNGILVNSPTVDAAGLESERIGSLTSRFGYSPGNATTHRMSLCTWVIRIKRVTTVNGAFFKVGYPRIAGENNLASLNGWGIGFGDTTFESSGNNTIFLREGVAFHNFGFSQTPGAGVFCSYSIRFTSTGFVVRIADSTIGTVTGLPSASADTPYISFGGYDANFLNRFSSTKIRDVMQFTRDLTSDERLWLSDENNSLLSGGGIIPIIRQHYAAQGAR
jgi:hypothetical protein